MNKSTLGVVAAIAVAACGPALAADPAAADTAQPATSNELRATRDQETGQLRAPTAEERAELAAVEKNFKRSGPATVQLRTLSDGTRAAVLPESFQTTVYAVRDADGNLRTFHSDPALDSAPAAKREEK
jgi:hypothetical protein